MQSPSEQQKIQQIRDRFGNLLLNGRYRLDRLLGMGGMGAVFLAADERLGREVAVKVMVLGAVQDEERERHRRRFLREARMVAMVHHPNVVVIHDFGTQPDAGGDIDYLVMELLKGHTLAQRLPDLSRVDARVLLPILAQAAEGVAAGHARGIVHRDVKPGNLFLSHRGDGGYDVKVVDFGLARPAEDDGAHGRITTASGNFMSREYASPEQQRGSDDLGPQTDVFSLGVVAYRLFAGTHPFTVEDQGRFAIGAPVYLRSPSTFAPEIPGGVERVIMRALQPDPDRRHPDAGALAEELREVMSALDARPSPRAHAYHGFDTAAAGDRTEAVETQTAAAIPYVAPRVPAADPVAAEPVAPDPGPRVEAPALAAELRAALAAMLGGAAARVREWRARPLPPVPPKVWRAAAVVGVAGLAVGLFHPAARAAGWVLDRVTTSESERNINARKANDEGLALLGRKQAEAAVTKFRRAREMNPDNAEFHNNYGYGLMDAGRLPEAIAVLDSVIARYPRRDVAHGNLGEAHLLSGDTARAIEHFEHYARLVKPGKGGWYLRELRRLKRIRAEALRADSLLSLPIPAPAPAPPAAPPSRRYEPPAPRPSEREPAPEPRREPPRRASPSTAFRDSVRLGGPRPSYVPPRRTATRDTIRLPERRR